MRARDYVFSLEQIGIKLGLEQIRALLDALGRPDLAFPSIVIAGTNGKGSVTAMVERALRAAGYRTGRYTSPHLSEIEERFGIDGTSITPEMFDEVAPRIVAAAAGLPSPPSFFEATTALALEVFRDARIDVAVLEVGLGGRLDATNAVQSEAVAITSVDFDHEMYLGHTLEAIAAEKAGVIKPNGLAVLAANPDEVRKVVQRVSDEQHARLVYAPDGVENAARMVDGQIVVTIRTQTSSYEDVHLGLRGRHQIGNAVVAVRLLEELAGGGRFAVPQAAIRTGLEDVRWPGRLELVRWRGHDVLIDGAHNPAGARALSAYLTEAYGRPLPIVLGVMRDKNIEELVGALAAVASHFVTTAVQSPRAAAADDVAATVRRVSPATPIEAIPQSDKAVQAATRLGNPVVVAGSLYLAGEIRSKLS